MEIDLQNTVIAFRKGNHGDIVLVSATLAVDQRYGYEYRQAGADHETVTNLQRAMLNGANLQKEQARQDQVNKQNTLRTQEN